MAGGFGARLRGVVSDVPKPMAPMGGKPFLEILLQALRAKGVERVTLSVGYMAEIIINHFGSRFGTMEINYVVEDQPLGTGGAIRLALESVADDYALVMNGDTFMDIEVSLIDNQYNEKHRPIIAACEVENTERYGRVFHRGGVITGFGEKAAKGRGLINAGCYVMAKDELSHFALGKKFSFENDYLQHAVQNRKFDIFITKGDFVDIGIPEDYYRAKTLLERFIH